MLGAEVEHVLTRAVAGAVLVLDGDDLAHRERALELLDAHVGDADLADLALCAGFDERRERILEGNRGVGPVELVEVDRIDAQPSQRALERRADVLGAPVPEPATGPCPGEARLGREDQPVEGAGRPRDQLLADVRPV